MRKRLRGNERLINAIIPTTFTVGCRRPTPGNGYLEAIQEKNVHIFTEMFREITERGFIDADGQEHEVDIIVCATSVVSIFWARRRLIICVFFCQRL
jgi:cation diffusion facilitator CzcD-associated flavoprotein CzcO